MLYLDKNTKAVYTSVDGSSIEGCEQISVYDAIELVEYHGHNRGRFANFTNDDILRQHKLRDIELYGWCVVIEENSDVRKDFLAGRINIHELVQDYKKDYVLLGKTGTVDLYHLSNDFSSLIANGYVPSKERIETGGGSFGVGL